MGDPTLRINFSYDLDDDDLGDDDLGDDRYVDERNAFWNSQNTFEWFQKRGYTLYKPQDEDVCLSRTFIPRLPFVEDIHEGEYPYAAYDGRPARSDETFPLRAYEARGKVVFAQDTQNRHVAIKLVRLNTDEHRIYEFLKEQPVDLLKENCVLPVLDILPIKDFCFVVMPRWGCGIISPKHRTIKQVLQVMHDALKGLAFLHQHNIIHGDIKVDNFLEDDFRDSFDSPDTRLRVRRRAAGLTRYAIFDFDRSRKIPQEIDRRNYWVSVQSQYAWGTFNVTMDYAQGELEYNPFITEVGSLGAMFSQSFQHVIPHLPDLAPFIDMLTTHKLHQRFTASEALEFFENFYADLSEEELAKELNVWNDVPHPQPYYDCDRWASVPPHLARKWAIYREPPLSLRTRLLRKLFQHKWLYYPKVILVRQFLAKIPKAWRALLSLVSSVI
ncbi:hypothetical protein CPC08DRAFT_690409 [Agrocybe pediades]|nr:hypothetical protein CPC08DRAFT_690409 [Agrocybe pediades]